MLITIVYLLVAFLNIFLITLCALGLPTSLKCWWVLSQYLWLDPWMLQLQCWLGYILCPPLSSLCFIFLFFSHVGLRNLNSRLVYAGSCSKLDDMMCPEVVWSVSHICLLAIHKWMSKKPIIQVGGQVFLLCTIVHCRKCWTEWLAQP